MRKKLQFFYFYFMELFSNKKYNICCKMEINYNFLISKMKFNYFSVFLGIISLVKFNGNIIGHYDEIYWNGDTKLKKLFFIVKFIELCINYQLFTEFIVHNKKNKGKKCGEKLHWKETKKKYFTKKDDMVYNFIKYYNWLTFSFYYTKCKNTVKVEMLFFGPCRIYAHLI